MPSRPAFPKKLTEAPTPVSEREQCLNRALQIVSTDRNVDYGDPEDNFRDIAEMWTTYLGYTVSAIDVAHMMVLTKVCRAKTSPFKLDHYDDIAGYAACGADVAVALNPGRQTEGDVQG